MKKLIVLFLVNVLVHFSGISQFSFRVFPTGVSGDPFADTILNARAILVNAGVRQVNAYQTLPETTKTFATKTASFNKDGSIDKMTTCFARNPSNNFTHCIDYTILYDDTGREVSMKMTDNAGNKYQLAVTSYRNGGEIRYSSTGMALEDTMVSYQSYNEKGQLVKLIRTLKGKELENTSFYYNTDGLLDSTQNTYWGVFIFKRRKKKGIKLVETKTPVANYQWAYNHSGQCIGSTIIVKNRPDILLETGSKDDVKTVTSYYYNPDGTLSKVTTKSSRKPTFTMYYSYLK